MALRVFQWLLACQGSIDKQVLLAAISQTLKQSKANEVYRDTSAVLAVCQNLVVAEGDLLRFSHLSVQEYCESHQADLMEDCHSEVVKVCVWILFYHDNHYLAHRHWTNCHVVEKAVLDLAPVPEGHNELYTLWQFAYDVWHDHFQQIKRHEQKHEIIQLMKGWIGECSPRTGFANWVFLKAVDLVSMPLTLHVKVIRARSPRTWIETPTIPRASRSSKLPVTGSAIVLESILAGFCWNMKDDFERYLLDHNHSQLPNREGLIDLLEGEEYYYDVDAQDIEILELMTVLSDYDGLHDHHVKLTIAKGLVHFKSILERAELSTHKCYEELASLILLLLCVQETDLSSAEAEFATWLFQHFPSLLRNDKISYQWLVPPIAYLDLSTSLLRAAEKLRTSFIKILLNHEAQINARAPENSSKTSGTPLITAICCGKFESTKVLLDYGADVNMEARVGDHGTALIAACAGDNIEILSLLLDHSHTIINQGSSIGKYGTALIAACANRRRAAVQLLLEKHAHVNAAAKNGVYGTAIFAAADTACLRIVRLLVRGGARGVPEATGRSWKLDGSREPTPELEGVQELSWRLAQRLILDSVRAGADDGIDQNDQDVDDGEVVIASEDESDDSDEDDSDEYDSDEVDSDEDKGDKPGGVGAGVMCTRGDTSQLSATPGTTAPGFSNQDDASQYNTDRDTFVDDSIADMTGILRQLNREISISYTGTAKIIADVLGFENHKNKGALWKGIEKLLKATDKKDWELVKDSWVRFIDLAEDCDCETKGPGDVDVEQLASGELLPLSSDTFPSPNLLRQESGFDYSPYETELDI
ncbi:hypothetical protein F4820DRAFT_200126 [Hypoxylon rubiginosum]|uniref:Uncharacterized protein n=1 Tax=Hypoxylon rubiginosum TaxID=110542 RepID=A0ACB9YHF5_9PEZI|nr:hypothetical protein F4820DRAFT_200126 [Hypoxylon rubiginosum]